MDGVALLNDLSDDDAGVVAGFTCVWHNRSTGQHGKLTQYVLVDYTSGAAAIQTAVTTIVKQAMADAAGIGSWPTSGSRFKLLGIQ
jgi:hypothetical protein